MKALAEKLGTPFRDNLQSQFQAAFMSMWEDDLRHRDPAEFLKRLESYAQSDHQTSDLPQLSAENLNDLIRFAKSKIAQNGSSQNPFS